MSYSHSMVYTKGPENITVWFLQCALEPEYTCVMHLVCEDPSKQKQSTRTEWRQV